MLSTERRLKMIAGISIVILFVIVTLWCVVLHNTTEYDDKVDDEEQIRYLQEWSMKHRKR